MTPAFRRAYEEAADEQPEDQQSGQLEDTSAHAAEQIARISELTGRKAPDVVT